MSETDIFEPVKFGSDEKTNQINIIDIILTASISDEIKEKISIKLTPDIVKVINTIIKLTPNMLIDIEVLIIEIIKDNKIDSNDIPEFIAIIQKIYQIIYSIKIDEKNLTEYTSTILKYIIHLLVFERIIKIDDDKQLEFLNNCDRLIDSCIGLINFPSSLRVKKCCKLF